MPDIFDEVSEDLRADRAQALLRRYGWVFVAAAIAVVAVVAAWEGWRWYQRRQDEAAAGRFLAAMRTGQPMPGTGTVADPAAALTQFAAIAADAPRGYAVLARLRAAGLKADAGDLPGADALWDQVAADGSADPLLRDLANLAWAQRNVDAGDPVAVRAHLSKLPTEADSPLRALGAEAGALLDLRLGRTEPARAALTHLAEDSAAPEGLRTRARGLLARIGA